MLACIFHLLGIFCSLFQLFILPCFSIKQFPWKLVKINDNSYFILSSTIRHRIEWSLWSQWYRQYTSTVQNVGNTGQASDRHNYNRGGGNVIGVMIILIWYFDCKRWRSSKLPAKPKENQPMEYLYFLFPQEVFELLYIPILFPNPKYRSNCIMYSNIQVESKQNMDWKDGKGQKLSSGLLWDFICSKITDANFMGRERQNKNN